MKRFLVVILGGLLVPLLGVLFTSSYASAASDYDGVIKVTDKVELNSICGRTDLLTKWGNYITDPEAYIYPNTTGGVDNAINLWNTAKGWGLVQSGPARIDLYFHTNETPPDVIWYEDYGGYNARATSSYNYQIVYDNNCDVKVWTDMSRDNYRPLGSTLIDDYTTLIFLYNYNWNLPPDYEGVIPPDTVGPPLIERPIIAPDFAYSYEDKTITATDHVNELIPEFVPDEGYTSNGPDVQWTLWKCSIAYEKGVCKGDREIVDLTNKPLNNGITWTVEEYGFYKIEAEYSLTQCYRYASYPDTPDHCFNASLMALFGDNYVFEMRSKEFNLDGTSGSGDTINEDCDIMGSCSSPGSITGGMLPCFTSDFPYVDVQGCVTNVFWIVDSLTFSQVTIMDIKSNTLECKQLNTVGAWIHKPGITVCPMFPEHVRNVVTPFVTFAFVLMLAGFLMRISRDRT